MFVLMGFLSCAEDDAGHLALGEAVHASDLVVGVASGVGFHYVKDGAWQWFHVSFYLDSRHGRVHEW